MADDDPVIMLMCGGPSVCLVCGRTFTEGGAIVDVRTVGGGVLSLCIWCIAGWLEEVTDWRIVDQMRGWLVARQNPPQAKWRRFDPPESDPGAT